MIGALLKNWRFILDVLIVLVIVIAIFIWNPFGIFGGGLKLNETANMVTEVNQIGQLVTAEYYGEVIASIDEARLNFLEDEQIRENAVQLFRDLNLALSNLKTFQNLSVKERDEAYQSMTQVSGWRRLVRNEVNSRNIQDKLDFHGFLEDIEADPLYLDLLEYVYRWKTNRPRNIRWGPSPRHRREALFLLYEELGNSPAVFSQDNFMNFYYQNRSAEFSRREARKKLAMVGRGWVKAGFDFTHLDTDAIVIYEDIGEVHIRGLAPKILNADINPWFIPEKGVPGFEILDYNGIVDFRDAQLVKEYCVDKLLSFAHKAEILKNAESQGAETLKNFFSLLTGKTINKVVFHHDNLFLLAHAIEENRAINRYQLGLFDSLLRIQIDRIDSMKNLPRLDRRVLQKIEVESKNVRFMISRLQNLPVLEIEQPYGLFSNILFQTAGDSVLSPAEIETISRLRRPIDFLGSITETKDSIPFPEHFWYNQSWEYWDDYNRSIDFLISQNLTFGQIKDTTVHTSSLPDNFFEENQVVNMYGLSADYALLSILIDPTPAEKTLSELYYPFTYRKELISEFITSKIVQEQKEDVVQNQEDYWILEDRSNENERIAFPYEFLPLFLAEQYRPLQSKDSIYLTADILIYKTSIEGKGGGNLNLSTNQQAEFNQYLSLLMKDRKDYQNKGILSRANYWVKERVNKRRSTPTWLTSMKTSLN